MLSRTITILYSATGVLTYAALFIPLLYSATSTLAHADLVDSHNILSIRCVGTYYSSRLLYYTQQPGCSHTQHTMYAILCLPNLVFAHCNLGRFSYYTFATVMLAHAALSPDVSRNIWASFGPKFKLDYCLILSNVEYCLIFDLKNDRFRFCFVVHTAVQISVTYEEENPIKSFLIL